MKKFCHSPPLPLPPFSSLDPDLVNASDNNGSNTTNGSNGITSQQQQQDSNILKLYPLPESVVRSAIGEPVPPEYEPEPSLFKSIPRPGPLSWLSLYPESGQSFQDFVREGMDNNDHHHPRKKQVCILPIGDFGGQYFPLHVLQDYLQRFFQMSDPIPILPCIRVVKQDECLARHGTNQCQHQNEEPSMMTNVANCLENGIVAREATLKDTSTQTQIYFGVGDDAFYCVKCRRATDHGGYQLHVNDILDMIDKTYFSANESLHIIGVTLWDLYLNDSDLFVVGWSKTNCAVFSFARYDPLFATAAVGDMNQQHPIERSSSLEQQLEQQQQQQRQQQPEQTHRSYSRESTILRRSLKTITHELLHLYGLRHCIYFSCLMNGTASLFEDDLATMFLCPVCLRKLHSMIQFSLEERYQDLMNFFLDGEYASCFCSEVAWLSKRIDQLRSIR